MTSHNITGVDTVSSEAHGQLLRGPDHTPDPIFQVDSCFVKDLNDGKADYAQSKVCYVAIPVGKQASGCDYIFQKARFVKINENVIKVMEDNDSSDHAGSKYFTAFRVEKTSTYSVTIPPPDSANDGATAVGSLLKDLRRCQPRASASLINKAMKAYSTATDESTGAKKAVAIKRRKTSGKVAKSYDALRKGTFRFLELPGEIRNMIYDYMLVGDGSAIHMNRKEFATLERGSRLAATVLCKQTRAETNTLPYFAHALFVFQTSARLDYGILEHMWNWLWELAADERDEIKKLVVCSKLSEKMVKWAVRQAEWCSMDFGFRVRKRLDKKVVEMRELADGKKQKVTTMVPWGREKGHFCEHEHYELVRA